MTQLFVLREDQFARYHCNPFAVAQTAITLGEMRYCINAPSVLPSIMLPDRPLVPSVEPPHGPTLKYHRVNPNDGVNAGWLMEVLQSLHNKESVAVIGAENPVKFATHVIERIPTDERPTISVTTGLEHTLGRPFRLHFLKSLDENRRRVLEALGARCLFAPAPMQSETSAGTHSEELELPVKTT